MLIIGLMSGTSADGTDAAIVRLKGAPPALEWQVISHTHIPHSPTLRDEIFACFRPETGTAADLFGRIHGQHSTTASNIAKYDGWHGVVVFENHHPLRFTEEEVADYIDTAQDWARRAHEADPEACYPFFLWNCLWRSGASILHGHAQMTLTRGMHYVKIEALRQA